MSQTRFYEHFKIPQRLDFMDDSFQIHLTGDARQLFEQGNEGQGYIGLVNLENGEIHLVPSFNKDDGLLRVDKNGKKFKRYMETEQTLGGSAGDLHTRSAAILTLGENAGKNGKLLGFGIWKGGNGVKFVSEVPDNNLRLIPNEYILTKNKENNWEVYFVKQIMGERKISKTEISEIPGLEAALSSLPDKKPEQLTFAERSQVENLLHSHGEATIKYAKNRSSSQNMFSCIYTADYGKYFDAAITGEHGDAQERAAHQVALRRELPFPVFEKILNSVSSDLKMQNALTESMTIIPNDKNDNYLLLHLRIEKRWMSMMQKLKNNDLYNADNIKFIINFKGYAEAAVNLLIMLRNNGMIDSESKKIITSVPSENLSRLGSGFFTIIAANKLNRENIDLLVTHSYKASELADAILKLKTPSADTKENRIILASASGNMVAVADAIEKLHRCRSAFPGVEQVLAQNPDEINSIVASCLSFKLSRYSNEEYQLAIKSILSDSGDYTYILKNFNILRKEKLFNDANRVLLATIPAEDGFELLTHLKNNNLLTAENLKVCFSAKLTQDNFSNIPQILDTHAKFQDLKTEILRIASSSHSSAIGGLFAYDKDLEKLKNEFTRLQSDFKYRSIDEVLDQKNDNDMSLREMIARILLKHPASVGETFWANVNSPVIEITAHAKK